VASNCVARFGVGQRRLLLRRSPLFSAGNAVWKTQPLGGSLALDFRPEADPSRLPLSASAGRKQCLRLGMVRTREKTLPTGRLPCAGRARERDIVRDVTHNSPDRGEMKIILTRLLACMSASLLRSPPNGNIPGAEGVSSQPSTAGPPAQARAIATAASDARELAVGLARSGRSVSRTARMSGCSSLSYRRVHSPAERVEGPADDSLTECDLLARKIGSGNNLQRFHLLLRRLPRRGERCTLKRDRPPASLQQARQEPGNRRLATLPRFTD